MSKQIDLTSPLSDEDRAYLLVRGRTDLIAQSDAIAAGQEWSESMLTSGEVLDPNGPAPLPPNTGDVNPVPVEERSSAWGEQLEEDETALEDIGQTGGQNVDYSQFKKAQLVSEIERRNATYDASYQLDASGKVAELIAVLEADDATPASSEESDSEES